MGLNDETFNFSTLIERLKFQSCRGSLKMNDSKALFMLLKTLLNL